MAHLGDLEFERDGAGRPLVLLSARPNAALVKALTRHFDVLAFTFTGEHANTNLKLALEQHRIERPLLVVDAVETDIATKRIPRGVVILRGPAPSTSSPIVTLSGEDPKLTERIVEFDATLA